MQILMIGGTALVGPHVIRELMADGGDQVWTLTRTGKAYFCETPLQGDRDDGAALSRALHTARPDVIIDMIPFTQENARALTEAVAKLNPQPRLVALSSIDVYAGFGRVNGTEEAPYQPAPPIGEQAALRKQLGPQGAAYDKIGVEAIFTATFEAAIILRLPATYGWPDTTRVAYWLDQMLDSASLGAPQIAMPQDRAAFRFSRCLHKNAAFAVALAARSPLPGVRIYNVAEPAMDEAGWARRIAAACGWPGEIVITPWTQGAERPCQHLEVDTAAIRHDLGFYEKYNVDEGLADTVAFHAYGRLGKAYVKGY